MTPAAHLLAQSITAHLLNSAIAGVTIACVAWTLLRLVGRQNACTRFIVWFSALLAIAAVPFVSALSFAYSATHAAIVPHGQLLLSSTWASFLFVAWILVASVLLLRLAVGLWRVRSVRQNSVAVDLATLPLSSREILRSSPRPVTVCTSDELTVPSAVGLFHPTIIFPRSLFSQLSDEEIEMIVRHEFAHLCRWDDWTNLIQKFLKALFFFHPAVWWIENRLTLEREIACDDIVLAQIASPRAYAASLISFAEKLHCARGLALAQSLLSRMHQMSQRITEILDARPPTHSHPWKPILVFGTLLGFVFGTAAYLPPVIAFQEQPAAEPASYADQITLRNGDLAHLRAQPVILHENSASHPKAIRAALDQRPIPRHHAVVKTVSAAPLVLRASANHPAYIQESVFVFETSAYSGSLHAPSEIWTLCIWRISGDHAAPQLVDSAIVVKKI